MESHHQAIVLSIQCVRCALAALDGLTEKSSLVLRAWGFNVVHFHLFSDSRPDRRYKPESLDPGRSKAVGGQ